MSPDQKVGPSAATQNGQVVKKPGSPLPDSTDTDTANNDHWLVRPTTIRLLWWLFSIILVLSILAQLVFKVKGYFGVDGWLGFGAVFGFLACLAMVLVARALGWLLKRDESYYNSRSSEGRSDEGGGNV